MSTISKRTGRRCTTLTQLPDAFCGGNNATQPLLAIDATTVESPGQDRYPPELGRLANTDVGQLRFLIVGAYPKVISADQGEYWLPSSIYSPTSRPKLVMIRGSAQ